MANRTIRSRAVLALYLLMATIHINVGIRYFFAEKFMPYHAEAVGTPWEAVDAAIQTLVLALMTVAGAGWLSLGFLSVVLALAGYRNGSLLARWVLPLVTIIFYLGSFTATWAVYRQTGASTPWGLSVVMVGMALLGLAMDMPWSVPRRTNQPGVGRT